jgi:exopolysaccharide production protein ExoQ
MPPILALLIWLVLLVGLFRYDPAKDKGLSLALWVPLLWTALLASRSLSLWLDYGTASSVAAALEEGNALDHTVYLALMLAALGILMRRAMRWDTFFTHNVALILFLLFAFISLSWSDFPLASFRRWLREIGSCLMILVVLTDPRPAPAVEAFIRRTAYLLIPLSVVVIKYFRGIGVAHSPWTGVPEFMGVTTSKNMLGVLCLISGVFFFWDMLRRWPDRRARRTKRVLYVDAAFIAMTLWLLRLANSATSLVCLIVGCTVIVLAQSRWAKENPRRLKITIPLLLFGGFLLDLIFTVSRSIAELLGRDPTLTGRTEIWAALLDAKTNPLWGVGYESFWLGERLFAIWRRTGLTGLNEAHNGYLETYLNLGLIGLCLLGALIIASYQTIFRWLSVSPQLASLSMALWTIALLYNFTESAFKNSLVWFMFLLFAISVPRRLPEPRSTTWQTAKTRMTAAQNPRLVDS